jgi:hypothetical protein
MSGLVPREGGAMPRLIQSEAKKVAMQLTTDEGAFICNVDEADIAKMSIRDAGTFIIVHHVIRLDAMFEGLYEIHRTKMIETSSIDSHHRFRKETRLRPLRV